jgi:hypothetical protein
MGRLPKKGDKVSLGTSQGETHGTVEKVVRRTTKIAGYVAKATPANPEVLVKSAKTGKQAVHKPGALKKTR